MAAQESMAYCGLVCRTCAIYLATREADPQKQQEMRARIAQICNEHYGGTMGPEDVGDCDGCRAETGRLFCATCEIRACARGKGVKNCAHCEQYPCEKLEKLFVSDPAAKTRLDVIRGQS